MLTFIYKTKKKDGMYLYITERDNFDQVPEELMKRFGTPIFSMVVNLENRQLAQVDVEKVKTSLNDDGFFLQVQPPFPNLLTQYKQGKGYDENA